LLRGAQASQIRGKTNPRDLVTEWDVRSEECIRRVLGELTPGVPVLGEELGGDTTGDARWIVDPIDGTVNFAHGLPIWSVSIAFEENGVITAGVVAAPVLGWWHEATLGGGAVADGAPARVSEIAQFDHALLVTGFPYDRATSPENNFAEWEHMQRRAGACRRLGSAAIDLCLVARGWMDGYWERKLKVWDVAAASLIVTEAGGRVTDWAGAPPDLYAGSVVATNGAIHEELVAELGRVHQEHR
jgi:myo-inositol-1(or 4)-monophosphatase